MVGKVGWQQKCSTGTPGRHGRQAGMVEHKEASVCVCKNVIGEEENPTTTMHNTPHTKKK